MAERMEKEQDWPGARRRSYLFAILLLPIAWKFVIDFASPLLIKQFGGEIGASIILGATFVPAVVWIYFGIRRLMNVGMSGLWFIGNFIPLLNIWIGYRSFACPAGYAYHKKLDGIGIFLAIIYWLGVLIGLAAIGLLVAVFFGAYGSPELQEKLRQMVNTAIHPTPVP